MLLHFQNDIDRSGDIEALAHYPKGLVDRRHGRLVKLHIHRGTGDLNYVSNILSHKIIIHHSTFGIQSDR